MKLQVLGQVHEDVPDDLLREENAVGRRGMEEGEKEEEGEGEVGRKRGKEEGKKEKDQTEERSEGGNGGEEKTEEEKECLSFNRSHKPIQEEPQSTVLNADRFSPPTYTVDSVEALISDAMNDCDTEVRTRGLIAGSAHDCTPDLSGTVDADEYGSNGDRSAALMLSSEDEKHVGDNYIFDSDAQSLSLPFEISSVDGEAVVTGAGGLENSNPSGEPVRDTKGKNDTSLQPDLGRDEIEELRKAMQSEEARLSNDASDSTIRTEPSSSSTPTRPSATPTEVSIASPQDIPFPCSSEERELARDHFSPDSYMKFQDHLEHIPEMILPWQPLRSHRQCSCGTAFSFTVRKVGIRMYHCVCTEY